MGQFAQAQVSYRTVRRLTRSDPVANARLLLKLARVQGWQDRYSQALSYITRGLRAIDDLDGDEAARQRARLLAWYGRFCLQAGHHRRALEYCRRAIDEAEMAGEKEALADALQISDWAYEDLGQLELATNWHRALELYEELGNLPGQSSIYNTVGVTAYAKGEWQEALDAYQQARDAVARTGDAVMYGVCSNNIGEIFLDQGHLDRAGELFRDALHAWQASGFRAGIGFAKRNLARLASVSGEHDEAIRLFEESLADTTAAGAQADALETNARLAEALLRRGDADAALALAGSTLSRARSLGGVTVILHRVQGAALARRGDFAAAQEALEHSLEGARARDADYEIALDATGDGATRRAARSPPRRGLAHRQRRPVRAAVGCVGDRSVVVRLTPHRQRMGSSPGNRILMTMSKCKFHVIDSTHGGVFVQGHGLQSGSSAGVPGWTRFPSRPMNGLSDSRHTR